MDSHDESRRSSKSKFTDDQVEIRLATVADLNGIWGIYDYYILHSTATAQETVPSDEEKLAWLTEHHDDLTYPVYVATLPALHDRKENEAEPANDAAETIMVSASILDHGEKPHHNTRVVVGWCCASQWSPREASSRTAETSVYVAADARGLGLGKRLMETLIRHMAATRRTDGARAEVHTLIARLAGNNPASSALHEHLGYRKIGVMVDVMEKFGGLFNVELYQLIMLRPVGQE